MIEVFLLVGWIGGHGYNAGGVISQEFNSLATCEAVKKLFIEMHEIKAKEDRYPYDGWVECIKK